MQIDWFATNVAMKKILLTIGLLICVCLKPLFAGVDKEINVRDVQTRLALLCSDPGPIDGLWGAKTERAVQALYTSVNGKYDGQFDLNDLAFLHGYPAMHGKKSCTMAKRMGNAVHYFNNNCCEIPDSTEWQPNDATLEYYYKQTANLIFREPKLKVMPGASPLHFKKDLKSHSIIDQEMATKTILSYLFYKDGYVIYDALPPENRFSINFDNTSYFPSHSMGKSITSYLVGHAICQGYISSIDAPIGDWPLMENTLYYGQPLIKLLNMQAGDAHVVQSGSGRFTKTRRSIHGNAPLMKATRNPAELKNTTAKGGERYSYSNLASDVIFNYVMHRVGEDFDNFISDFYRNKVKIEYPVYLWMNPVYLYPTSTKVRIEQGAGQYGISATRYDFLRIAKAIMDDWQNDTCEGQYLKEVYRRRVSKNNRPERWDSSDRRWGNAEFGRLTRRYGGQFHLDVVGLRDREILVMNGANGQQIAIDMDNSRIVVISAVKSHDYDTYRLGFQPIKYGRIK